MARSRRPAQAATLTNAGGVLTYNAGVGDPYASVLYVRSSFDGSDCLSVYKGTADPLTAAPGCAYDSTTSDGGLPCPGVTCIVLNGGPGSDDMFVSGAKVPATLAGGPGD